MGRTDSGNVIKELARRRNVSQSDLANSLGVSAQYISNVATGRADLTLGFIGRVFVIMGPEAAHPLRLAAMRSGIIEELYKGENLT